MKRFVARAARVAQVAAFAFALSGCFRTHVVHGGTPETATPAPADERWHHSLVWGIVDVTGPYDLDALCPAGWASIETEQDLKTGFLNALTLQFLYTPQTVRIRCLQPAAEAADGTAGHD
jgi:hypothetical protein